MKIAYYMPFKPLGHANPSGDLIIGTELYDFLRKNGVDIFLASKFRCRWLYYKPHLWLLFLVEAIRVLRLCRKEKPDLWLTYHSYYKAPDLLGPLCCRLLGIPYVIFQGIYSTKRRKKISTRAGFYLNRRTLLQASLVFTNKKTDYRNLLRLLPQRRVVYIPPGLHPEDFTFDREAREKIRERIEAGNRVIIMTAAMFRPGVKTEGICKVIDSCRILRDKGVPYLLLIAGDGLEREVVRQKAEAELGDAAILLGKLARQQLREYFSAADIFVFPGINESLGMVFLEAQACALPVVAFADWGAKEAIADRVTGLLSPAEDERRFVSNILKLVEDGELRQKMGRKGAEYVRRHHDIELNYARVRQHLERVALEGVSKRK